MREIRTSGLTRGEEVVLRHRLLSYSTATRVATRFQKVYVRGMIFNEWTYCTLLMNGSSS
jgi:hypothetical protein